MGAGGSRATDADTPVCDFTGAGAGQSGGRGARRGEWLGAHLVGGAVGSARPGGGDGPLRCLGDGTERDRSGPRGSARAEDVTHRSEGDIDHRSPALQLGLGDTQSTRGLPTPKTEGTCRWPRWGPPAPGGQGPLCPLLS